MPLCATKKIFSPTLHQLLNIFLASQPYKTSRTPPKSHKSPPPFLAVRKKINNKIFRWGLEDAITFHSMASPKPINPARVTPSFHSTKPAAQFHFATRLLFPWLINFADKKVRKVCPAHKSIHIASFHPTHSFHFIQSLPLHRSTSTSKSDVFIFFLA